MPCRGYPERRRLLLRLMVCAALIRFTAAASAQAPSGIAVVVHPDVPVDNLTVRSQVPGNFRPQPGAEPEMFVQFDVSGYALTGS